MGLKSVSQFDWNTIDILTLQFKQHNVQLLPSIQLVVRLLFILLGSFVRFSIHVIHAQCIVNW